MKTTHEICMSDTLFGNEKWYDEEEVNELQERINQLCDNLNAIEANKDAYKEEVEQIKKQVAKKKLRAYFWKPSEDSDTGIVVVAHNSSEAKKMGYKWCKEEYSDEPDTFIEQRVVWIRNAITDGLTKPEVVEDLKEGLIRNMYGSVESEEDCEVCWTSLHYWTKDNVVEGQLICDDCLQKGSREARQ